ncbi:MAG: methyltransferase domain-containing protein [Campylobacterales bacterium]
MSLDKIKKLASPVRMLNLGCGNRWHRDWINLDFNSNSEFVQKHNLYEPLPFENNSVDVVYSSHVLEHFPKCFAPIFLKECYRVLKSGTIIRVVVPDLEMIVRDYIEFLHGAKAGHLDSQEKYEWVMLKLFDQVVRNTSGGEMVRYWSNMPESQKNFVVERTGSELLNYLNNNIGKGKVSQHLECKKLDPFKVGKFRLSGEVHQWMYDSYSLKKLLFDVGFRDVKKVEADESTIPDFNSYCLDIESDGSVRKPDSLFIEAIKI